MGHLAHIARILHGMAPAGLTSGGGLLFLGYKFLCGTGASALFRLLGEAAGTWGKTSLNLQKMAAETSWWQGALLLAVLGLSLHLLPAYLPEFSQGLAGVWFLPWAVSLLWWGLPHGAVDHTIGAKLLDAQHPQRWVWPVAGVYFFIMLLMVGLWWWQPVIAFMAFIGVTWIHWGCGDLWWSWIREPESFPTLGSKLSFVLWRGGLPMLVPLVVDPASYRMTAEAATQWLNSGTIT